MRNIMIAMLLVFILAGNVLAHSGDTVYVHLGNIPIIDGVLSAGEWDDATSLTFTGYSGITITCYLKHNGADTLYIAQNVPEMPGGDHGYIWLDLDNDGGSTPQTDDYWLSKYYFEGEWFYPVETRGTGSNWGGWTESISGWSVKHTGEGWGYDNGQMEFAISYNKLGITAGIAKTIGFMIGFGDNQDETDCYFFPSAGGHKNPNNWADIISTDNWGEGTGVGEENEEIVLPTKYKTTFLANYPNPFNPETTIEFAIQSKGNISLIIYNIKGEEIRQFNNMKIHNGYGSVIWDGKNNIGKKVPSGVYLCQLKVDNKAVKTEKMLLMK